MKLIKSRYGGQRCIILKIKTRHGIVNEIWPFKILKERKMTHTEFIEKNKD